MANRIAVVMRPLILCAVMLCALMATGCGDSVPDTDEVPRVDDRGADVGGTAEAEITPGTAIFNVINLLRVGGEQVSVVSRVERPGLGDGFKLLLNDGVPVELYEYDTEKELADVQRQIAADGTAVAGKVIDWNGDARFFKSSRVIIVSVGGDSAVNNALKKHLGEHFAGK